MKRLHNVNKWTELSPSHSLTFANDRPRLIKLQVNPQEDCRLYYQDQSGELRFLARVFERDTVEFFSDGAFVLTCDGECGIYTMDGDDVSSTITDPVIFTKIAQRRRRSPELEFIAAQMQANMNRRLEQQSHELRRLFERSEEARAILAAHQAIPGGDPIPAKRDKGPKPSNLATPETDPTGEE